MVFSSIIFLFFYLPVTLFLYFISPRFLRNLVLLVLSLLFYAWGELEYVFILLLSIAANYLFGRLIARSRDTANQNLVAAIIFNLGLLGVFKYANFAVDNANIFFTWLGTPVIPLDPIHLPIGISFFTFHGISYVVDVYRGRAAADKTFVNFGLYMAFFPHQLAGPIVRYYDIAAELMQRQVTRPEFTRGIRRFTLGLAKKTLIANNMAKVVDPLFSLPPEAIGTQLAWLGIICYMLQIYFDFSGYSDMAIGLALMFGFHFPENFNFPYTATSISDFWRRWHMSLTTWIREYLFFPLSRYLLKKTNRHAPRLVEGAVYLFVMTLVGLWHGASWSFVVWGMLHGILLTIESLLGGLWMNKRPRVLRHIYVLLVVLIGWVFFRADTLDYALCYLQTLFSLRAADIAYNIWLYLLPEMLLALIFGIIFSMPIGRWLIERFNQNQSKGLVFHLGRELVSLALIAAVFLLSVMSIFSGSYNPFIYFRF